MIGGKYIVRLDDACPTMDKQKWSKVEDILDQGKVKPIVAVIPKNKEAIIKSIMLEIRFLWVTLIGR